MLTRLTRAASTLWVFAAASFAVLLLLSIMACASPAEEPATTPAAPTTPFPSHTPQPAQPASPAPSITPAPNLDLQPPSWGVELVGESEAFTSEVKAAVDEGVEFFESGDHGAAMEAFGRALGLHGKPSAVLESRVAGV